MRTKNEKIEAKSSKFMKVIPIIRMFDYYLILCGEEPTPVSVMAQEED